MFQRHADWVECLLVVRKGDEPGGEHIYSGGADGRVLHWRQDVEQQCDVFNAVVRPLDQACRITLYPPQACVRVETLCGCLC